jgi:hypothetical protein
MFCRTSVAILANLACAAVTAGAVAVTPLAALGVAMLMSDDPGGPMVVPIVGIVSLAAGVLAAAALFAATLIVDGVRSLAKARWWVASIVAAPALSAASALIAWLAGATPLVTLAVAGAVLVVFSLYWHAYLALSRLLDRAFDRLWPDRLCRMPSGPPTPSVPSGSEGSS